MATSTIKQNVLPTGVFVCSVSSANTSVVLFDSSGEPTSVITSGTTPTEPQKCLYQIDRCSSRNDAIAVVHFDSSEGKKTIIVADQAQNYSVRWYKAF